VRDEAYLQNGGAKDFDKEVEIMSSLDHEHLCKFHEWFEDEYIVYYVLDMCDGESLFEKLENDIVLQESHAAKVAHQMMSAVAYLHTNDIIHRDLKPENWILLNDDSAPKSSTVGENVVIRLTNFAFAEWYNHESTALTVPCGTLHYVAPEVLRGAYGKQADIWTLGVVIFLVLYGSYPFDGDSCAGVMKAILAMEPDWSDSCCVVSNEARLFLQELLKKVPEDRLTATAAVQASWFKHSDDARSSIASAMPNKPGNWRQHRSSIVSVSAAAQASLVQHDADLKVANKRRSCFLTSEFLQMMQEDQQSEGVMSNGLGPDGV
jgi:myosin-light-chain kinase